MRDIVKSLDPSLEIIPRTQHNLFANSSKNHSCLTWIFKIGCEERELNLVIIPNHKLLKEVLTASDHQAPVVEDIHLLSLVNEIGANEKERKKESKSKRKRKNHLL